MKRIIVALLLIVVVAGCSSSKGISSTDLCVTHINLDEQICYGQTKEEVEKAAGVGEKGVTQLMEYNNGLSVFYRDNVAVLISIDEDAAGVYESVVNIGESRKDVLKLYGKENIFSDLPPNTDYFYDSKNNLFINSETEVDHSLEVNKQIYVVSTRINSDGNVERVLLGDRQAVMFVN